MEHVERQEQREEELRGEADELEEQGDRMDEGTTELQQKVDNVREEFESRQDSSEAPGIQEPGDDEMAERAERDDDEDTPEGAPIDEREA